MATLPDYYATLQVDPRAEPAVIEAAYRKLAARYHPDVNSAPEAADQMRRINEARDALADPEKRARYDEQRTQLGPAGGPFGGGGASTAPRMTLAQTLVSMGVQAMLGAVAMFLVFEAMPRLKQWSIPIVLLCVALWFFWAKPYIEKNWGVGKRK